MMMMVVKMVWVDASHPLLHRIKPKELDNSTLVNHLRYQQLFTLGNQ